jgi:LPXTG-motif cell wall-anchored protein
VKQIDNAQQPEGTVSDAYAPKHMASAKTASTSAAQPAAAASAEALPNTSDTNDMAGAGSAAALGTAAIFASLRRRRHAE